MVVLRFSGCNNCDHCHGGNYHCCKVGGINNTVGLWRDGGWAQFCKVPSDQVHKIPDNITLEQAALTEPLSCVSHGWDLISPVHVGSKILIVGAGIIGNLWAAVLHLQGHRRVIVSEPNENRRKIVKQLGKFKRVVRVNLGEEVGASWRKMTSINHNQWLGLSNTESSKSCSRKP